MKNIHYKKYLELFSFINVPYKYSLVKSIEKSNNLKAEINSEYFNYKKINPFTVKMDDIPNPLK